MIQSEAQLSADCKSEMTTLAIFIFFLISIEKARCGLPPGTCFMEDNACTVHEDNLVSSFLGIPSKEECRQLCQDTADCGYLSYFGNDSFPFTDVCLLFKTCESLHPCPDCITEDKFCYRTCSNNVEGLLGENIVELMPDTDTELDCKIHCSKSEDCNFYTYHNASDLNYPSLCILLTHMIFPVQKCDFCNTGTSDCLGNKVCGLIISENSSLVNEYLFLEAPEVFNVHILSIGRCNVTIMGIGGGGLGGYKHTNGQNSGGGGGSGYVSLATYYPDHFSSLLVHVGGPGENSSVESTDSNLIFMALHGDNGQDFDGGDGYSGGGGDGNDRVGDGGSNGGNGENGSTGSGGRGSGIDISMSMFQMKNFTITPAESDQSPQCGGGGAGILINSKGPRYGYGGGGEGCSKANPSGGAIMIEIGD